MGHDTRTFGSEGHGRRGSTRYRGENSGPAAVHHCGVPGNSCMRVTDRRSTPRGWTTLAAIVLAALLPLTAGCGPQYPGIPTEPSPPFVPPVPSAPVPPGPAPRPATGQLEIVSFDISVFRSTGSLWFQYAPSVLRIAETSGRSAATVTTIDVTAPGGRAERDCPQERIRIGAGQTVDLIAVLGYCTPYAVTFGQVTEVSIAATFVDDTGGVGHVEKTVAVSTVPARVRPE